MKKIRLKDEYPWFSGDEYIEISDEIAEVFVEFAKSERSYKSRKYYHRAFYSLDAGDDIEKEILFVAASPHEIYIAINQLSGKQAKRIYAHFFQDIPMTQIARMEGIDESSVRESIARGVRRIEKIFKNF